MRAVARVTALLLCLAAVAPAQSARWHGTFAATAQGATLAGSWTAQLGKAPNTAFGAWALLNAAGKPIAAGTWSAAKAADRWEGGWRARVEGGREFRGTWTAHLTPAAPVPMSELFEAAAKSMASGNWQMGRAGGAWSIRAVADK